MTSYGSDLFAENLHSSGTIHWKNFDPPLSSDGGNIPTLAAVLEASDPEGDADGHVITNLGGLSMKGDANIANSDGKITGAAEVQCNELTTSFATALEVQVGDDLSLGTAGASGGTITFNSQASQGACSLTGPSATNQCVFTNCNFDSASNTFPTSIDDDTLADVLARGNSAGSTGINMNSQDISGFGQLLAGGASAVQLGPTQMFGALNMEAADATKHNITNANVIGAQAVGAVQISASGSLSATNISGRDINLNGIAGDAAILDFTGVAGSATQMTEIRGDDSLTDGVAQLTKCTYLDLSDSSNKLGLPTIEQFEWGAYIEPTTLTAVESQDEDWKDFGTEVYALSTATTATGHNKQLIKLQFNVVKWSFGNIMIGLDISDSDGSNKTGLAGKCWMTKFDPKGIQTTDRQKPGLCVMTFYVENSLLNDGNSHRIYPKVKTDFDDAPGEVRIAWGPGIDTNDNQGVLVGTVLIEGRPVPSQWRNYTGSGSNGEGK